MLQLQAAEAGRQIPSAFSAFAGLFPPSFCPPHLPLHGVCALSRLPAFQEAENRHPREPRGCLAKGKLGPSPDQGTGPAG